MVVRPFVVLLLLVGFGCVAPPPPSTPRQALAVIEIAYQTAAREVIWRCDTTPRMLTLATCIELGGLGRSVHIILQAIRGQVMADQTVNFAALNAALIRFQQRIVRETR